MKKVLLLLLMLFCITGCNINYELNYKNSGKISEKLEVFVEYDIINLYDENSEGYFTDVFYSYKTAYNLKNYKYKISELGTNSKITVSKIHSSLHSVISNDLLDTIFANKNVTENNGEITMYLSDYLYLQDDEWDIPAEPINVVIKSNYIVKSNAQEVNEFLGIYKWTFNPDDPNQTLDITFTNKLNVTAWMFNLNIVFYIIALLLVALFIIYLFIKFYKGKIKNVNKI